MDRAYLKVAGAGTLVRRCALSSLLVLLCLSPGSLLAEQFAVFNAALDQPRVNVVARLTPTGDPLIYTTSTIDLTTLAPIAVDSISFEAFLDTGASGHLISTDVFSGSTVSGTTYPGLHLAGTNTAPQLETSGGSNVTFQDVGAVGTGGFYISQPISLSISNYPLADPQDITQFTPLPAPVRAQIGPVPPPDTVTTDDLTQIINQLSGESFNLIGMPAMVGKVVVLDNRPLKAVAQSDITSISLDPTYMKTYVYPKGTPSRPQTLDTDPGVPSTKYTVKLTKVDLASYTATTPADGPKPDMTYNMFIGPSPIPGAADNGNPKLTLRFTPNTGGTTNQVKGTFLLDTGAAASMISKQVAATLGVEVRTVTTDVLGQSVTVPELWTTGAGAHRVDRQFTMAIQGVGGQTTVPGFYLDQLFIPTEQGSATNPDDPANIEFDDAPVLVNDIFVANPTDATKSFYLDGVLGMNFLTASADYDSNSPFGLTGAMAEGAFDWVTIDEQAGILGLEPAGVPEPAGLGALACGMILLARRRR